MVIDKKGRLFGKVSIIDLLIVLILIFAIVFLIKFFDKKEEVIEQKTITYTILVQEVEQGFIDKIDIGANVYNSVDNSFVGNIDSYEVEPYTETVVDAVNGKFVEVTSDNLFQVYLKIKVILNANEKGYYIGRGAIRTGKEMFIKSKGIATISFVVDLEEVEEDVEK